MTAKMYLTARQSLVDGREQATALWHTLAALESAHIGAFGSGNASAGVHALREQVAAVIAELNGAVGDHVTADLDLIADTFDPEPATSR